MESLSEKDVRSRQTATDQSPTARAAGQFGLRADSPVDTLSNMYGSPNSASDRGVRQALGPASHGLWLMGSDVGTNFVVRVPGVEHSWIGASLDAGAAGVIVPSVTSVDDARTAVRATFYPPLGERSWGPSSPMWDTAAPGVDEANAAIGAQRVLEMVAQDR
jgi:hypothetical protein